MPLFMFFFFFFLLLFLPSSSLPPSPLPDRRNSLSPFFLRHSLTCLGLCKVYVWKTIFDAWRVVVDQGMDNVAVGRAGNSCSTKIRAHEYTPRECHRSLLRGGGETQPCARACQSPQYIHLTHLRYSKSLYMPWLNTDTVSGDSGGPSGWGQERKHTTTRISFLLAFQQYWAMRLTPKTEEEKKANKLQNFNLLILIVLLHTVALSLSKNLQLYFK